MPQLRDNINPSVMRGKVASQPIQYAWDGKRSHDLHSEMETALLYS